MRGFQVVRPQGASGERVWKVSPFSKQVSQGPRSRESAPNPYLMKGVRIMSRVEFDAVEYPRPKSTFYSVHIGVKRPLDSRTTTKSGRDLLPLKQIRSVIRIML